MTLQQQLKQMMKNGLEMFMVKSRLEEWFAQNRQFYFMPAIIKLMLGKLARQE